MPSPSRSDELKLLLLRRWRASPSRGVMVDPIGLLPRIDPARDPARDEPRDGESDGGGSFDLADCTRSSSFCILPMRPRI